MECLGNGGVSGDLVTPRTGILLDRLRVGQASPSVLPRAYMPSHCRRQGTVLSSPGGDPWSAVAGLAFLILHLFNTLLGLLLGARYCCRGYGQELGRRLGPLAEGC